jgi:CHASE2 domain-containing sensor protein
MTTAGGSPPRRGAWTRPPAVFLSLLLLTALPRVLETSGWLRRVELEAYNVFQGLADLRARVAATDRAPVVIVDIGDLPTRDGVTPRAALRRLLAALRDAGARTVGIDIDFSPDKGLFVAADDPAFFAYCRTLGIPVFLGVARTAGNGRDAWLGRPEDAPLAAGIVIPNVTGTVPEGGAPGPYPLRLPRLGDGPPDALPSLGFALATALDSNVESRLAQPSVFAEPFVERAIVQGTAIPEFTVDYSFVRRLQQASVATRWDSHLNLTSPIDRDAVAGRAVIIGDLAGASPGDIFHTAGFARDASGVLLHASAATTLIAGPLWVLKDRWRIALDIVMIVVVATGLLLTKPFKSAARKFVLSPLAWSSIAIVLAGGFAIWLARSHDILWLDWAPASPVLLLHAFLEAPREAATAEPHSEVSV